MALYKFKVSDNSGTLSELLVEGDSQADATRRLQSRGLFPLEFLGEGGSGGAVARRGGLFRRRFDVIDFTDRLVPLLEAGIPLERALSILGGGMEDSYAASVIEDLRRGLHEGRRLSHMLRDRSHIFSELYASLVEVGEESGALAAVLADVRQFLNERRELVSYIVSASIYPVVVFLVSLSVLGILLGVIIPKFSEILLTAGVELTGATKVLIALSKAVRGYWWVIPLAAAAVMLFVARARRSEAIRERVDHLLLRTPFVKTLILNANLARLSRTMAIMMRSGVHILDTVSIGARVLQNRVLRQSLSGIGGELRRGERLADALGRVPYMPPFMIRMLAVGEETGNVAVMLEKTADRFENDLKTNIRRSLSLIEPAVIVCLGLIVGTIVITMFLAIMDMQVRM